MSLTFTERPLTEIERGMGNERESNDKVRVLFPRGGLTDMSAVRSERFAPRESRRAASPFLLSRGGRIFDQIRRTDNAGVL